MKGTRPAPWWRRREALLLAWLLLPALSCRDGRPPSTLVFLDVAQDAGIDFVHESGARGERHMPETVVGGVGWIDHDGDGLLDLYFVNGTVEAHESEGSETASRPANRLYRNRGDGTFEDVTETAGCGDPGYGCGLAVGDFDNDGWSDLYVTNVGRNVLYRNTGGRFENVSEAAGVAADGWSASAAFVDVDGDGLLDLYVCQYVDYDPQHACTRGGKPAYCSPKEFDGLPDRLYRNRGDGTFEDVSERAGVALAGATDGKSLGVVALDYDEDGDSDLYVVCDQVRNLLYRNRGDGTFDEVGLEANVAYSAQGSSQAGMGVDTGDVDLDGDADLVVTNFADEGNALYIQEAPGFFEDRSALRGLGGPSLVPLGFGVLLLDADLDGDLDLFVANGHVQDRAGEFRPGRTFAQPDQLFRNEGGVRFVEVSASAGLGIARPFVSRAAASADYDGDGDEDIAVLHTGAAPALLRNEAPDGDWIAFRLRGRRSNRDGYGARVRLVARRGGKPFARVAECRSARSYAAASDPRVRFGLGAGDVRVVEVTVRWPSGRSQRLEAPRTRIVHEIVEPEGAVESGFPR